MRTSPGLGVLRGKLKPTGKAELGGAGSEPRLRSADPEQLQEQLRMVGELGPSRQAPLGAGLRLRCVSLWAPKNETNQHPGSHSHVLVGFWTWWKKWLPVGCWNSKAFLRETKRTPRPSWVCDRAIFVRAHMALWPFLGNLCYVFAHVWECHFV